MSFPIQALPYGQRKVQEDQIDNPGAHFQNVEPPPDLVEWARARFGSKYDDILNKYGAVEYVLDEDGDFVVDITTPEDVIQKRDSRILYALQTGKEFDQGTYASSSLLLQLAKAEVSYIESQVSKLRTNPTYLQSLMELAAHLRPELIPDAKGTATKLDEILKNSQYLAQEVRYTVYNALYEVGNWTLVVRYLDELVKVEQAKGFVNTTDERRSLFDNARDVIELVMRFTAKRICGSARTLYPLSKFWMRDFDFQPKWSGARVWGLPSTESAALLTSKTLQGSLHRFSQNVDVNVMNIQDLMYYFRRASHEEIDSLGPYLIETISKLEAFWDFYRLLGTRDYSKPFTMGQPTVDLENNVKRAKELLNKASIERYIKSMSAFDDEKVIKKIWKEIDDLTLKRTKTTLEKLIGYEKLPPRWASPLRISRAPKPPSPAALEPSRPVPQPERAPQPLVEHPPADIQPVFYGGSAENAPPVVETPIRTVPKKKTKGKAAAVSKSSAAINVHETEKEELKPVFRVKAWVYEILRKIFDPSIKGQVHQHDFIKVMTSEPFNFDYVQGSGSRSCLRPRQTNGLTNQPFHIHTIHGRPDELDSRYEHDYAKRLQEDYGWNLRSFVVD